MPVTIPTLQFMRATNTLTFDGVGVGAIGSEAVFVVTGQVLVLWIGGHCTVDLAGASATLALGVTGSTSLFIGATTATGIDNGDGWMDTSPTDIGGGDLPSACRDTVVCNDILYTVATAEITGGTLRMEAYYIPLSSGALIEAA